MKKVFIDTLGCQMNKSDTERMLGMLSHMGYEETKDAKDADLLMINTCSIRQLSEDKAFSMIGTWGQWKRQSKPNLKIGFCGCVAQQKAESVFKRAPYVDFVLGTHKIYALPEVIEKINKGERVCECAETHKTEDDKAKEFEINRVKGVNAWIPITEGCNNFCTYCIVPYVRGRERSREKSLILDEARQMISAGYKDITLLGQNVNSYGKTLADKPTFAQLLHEIDSIDGDYWLRFMTSHPKDCSKELIDTIANGTHISKHLHLPFQSGSDRILKAMNRHYDRKKYLDIVNYAKEKIDGVSLTSDIIVGFPGETYEDFKETLSLIREVEFTSLFTFIYSPRVGTPAAKMDDPISAEEKSKWFRELLDVQEEIAAKRCASMVNNTEKVLIESETGKNGELSGRTSGNIIVELKGDKSLIGTFQNVKITQARNWILKGELV